MRRSIVRTAVLAALAGAALGAAACSNAGGEPPETGRGAVAADRGNDPRLAGAWRPLTYRIQGQDHPMEGLLIFTERYFSSNVFFQLTGGDIEDANVNVGPYEADGRRVNFTQWVRLQIRPGDPDEPIFLRRGEPEPAEYEIDGSRLEIIFPSKNRFILERLEE